MITIRNNCYKDGEKIPLYQALQAAVDEFINCYCDPKADCRNCPYRHVCYDLIEARDYAYKVATGGDQE